MNAALTDKHFRELEMLRRLRDLERVAIPTLTVELERAKAERDELRRMLELPAALPAILRRQAL